MRIALFAHGLRGDVWPTVALGRRLAARDNDVTVAVPGEFSEFAAGAGMRVVSLPFDLGAWLRTREGRRLLSAGGARLFRGAGRRYSLHADAMDKAFLAASEDAEALVGGLLTVDRALALGDRMGAPVAMLSQYPVAPSRDYPSVTLARADLRIGAANLAAGRLAYWLWRRSSEKPVESFRAKLGLPRRARAPFYRLMDNGAPVLHTFGRVLFPRPSDWAANLAVTGAWRTPPEMRDELGEDLPDGLDGWLDEGEPPVFLGFGSMPVLDPEPLFADIVAVTEWLGLRAILSENCIPDGGGTALPSHLRVVDTVDHDLLFPRCRAVVHHGGLGSTIASLRAGRPTMVCSVFADQPWWGSRVRKLGVGVHCPFRRLDRDRLGRGLVALLEAPVEERAAAIGAAICAEGDGLPKAARLLEEWLGGARATPA